MGSGEMTIGFEFLAALLTVLYIGKLLLQKGEIDRLYGGNITHICPFLIDKE